jgi:aminoglycoside phosphotransferase (APT) family kinase protein
MIARTMSQPLSWWQLPDPVRIAVESSLGSGVVEAETQPGGYSPGVKARIRTGKGRRAFVKPLSNDRHLPSATSYRREAVAMPHLPQDLPVPRLLDVYDDGNWVALVFEDIDGQQPAIPWRRDELDRVAGAIADLGAALDPSPWHEAPTFAEVNAGVMQAWRDLVASPPPDLEPSVRRMLDRLEADEVDLAEVVRGEALMHDDIRSDNLLLTPDGRVVFVDWGMPCKGAVWLDLMMFAVTADFYEGPDPDVLVRNHPLTEHVDPSSIDAVVLACHAVGRL